MKKQFLIIFFLIFGSLNINSQQGAVLYSLSEKNGLSDNGINCFFQDSRGVMWMGTGYGLNSFDGSLVNTYRSKASPNTLPSDVINDIKELNGALWIATGHGLSCFDLSTKKISNYFSDTANEVKNRYYALAVYENKILLATETGLQVFDPVTRKFSMHNRSGVKENNLRITQVFVDSKKRIWLATYTGLWIFDWVNKGFESCNWLPGNTQQDNLVNTVFEDRNGQLWAGTWSKGLWEIDPERRIIKTFLNYKGSSTNVLSIAEQKRIDGKYDFFTNAYLTRLDTLKQEFLSMKGQGFNTEATNSATRLFVDRNNLLWIACGSGVKIYDPERQYFKTTVFSDQIPLSSQGIALLAYRDGVIMGAEGNTALQVFSDSLIRIGNFSEKIHQKAAVMNIQQAPNGDYWLCTSMGLNVLDSHFKQKKLLLHDKNDPSSLPRDFLSSVLFLKSGEVLIMPWRMGVWKVNPVTWKCSRVLLPNGDTLLPRANLAMALEDKEGGIWFTDYDDGLSVCDFKNSHVEKIISPCRLTNQVIRGNRLWTVSAREIFEVDIITRKIRSYPLPDGKNKDVYDFIFDDNAVLWIATKSGLIAFNSISHRFQFFSEADGLYQDKLEITFAKLNNGNILMAGSTYATLFSPAILNHERNSGDLLFTGAVCESGEKRIENDAITLASGERNIQLSWALLHYSNPLGNMYYYKLDGADSDWKYAGTSGRVAYNSLEPGEYMFHYKALTSDGVTSPEKNLKLVILPPVWRTWWFMLIFLAFTSFVFFYVVRYISQRNLKEKLLRLEKEQAVEKERNRISRDMHDELGSGLTKIAVLTEVIKAQPQTAGHIDKISDTARGLVDSLDEMVWALNPRNDSLDKLVAYLAEYAAQYLESTDIELKLEIPLHISARYLSEEKRRNIFMVIKEFLNNTVKHSGAERVEINFEEFERGFAIEINDNGCGFNLNNTPATGNGVGNMLQRIKDIGGIARFNSEKGRTNLRMDFYLQST